VALLGGPQILLAAVRAVERDGALRHFRSSPDSLQVVLGGPADPLRETLALGALLDVAPPSILG